MKKDKNILRQSRPYTARTASLQRLVSMLVICFCLTRPSLSMENSNELDMEFLDARPSIQLYMAYAEFKMGKYELAYKMWQNIKGAGKAEALFNIGTLYEYGFWVAKDKLQAVELYLQSAELGSTLAAYRIGLISLDHPELISEETAKQWLTFAALDGDKDAQQLLATMYKSESPNDSPLIKIRRLLVAGQHSQALEQLKHLSEQQPPNYDAMTELAWLYEAGVGVERDINQAASLFREAARAGNAKAQYAISVMLTSGVGLEQDEVQGQYWLKQSAQNGYSRAINKIKDLP